MPTARISVSAMMTLLLAAGLLVPASGQVASEEEPGWTNLNPDPRPDPLDGSAMTYVSQSDRIVLFGGGGPNRVTNETWSYDFNDNSWVDLRPEEAPLHRFHHALAYDVESERVILYGGNLGTRAGEGRADTWVFDYAANTWTNVTPDLSPPRRDHPSLAYDVESDRIILFGGRAPPGNFPQNDTWAYDTNTNTWTDMDPVVRPPKRCCHALAYDVESDRVILFGGITNGVMRRDTWSYDFNANTWTERLPDPRPGELRFHAMIHDSQADRVILFGGTATAHAGTWHTNETWAYDHNRNQWTNLTLARSPPIRTLTAMAYDEESDRVILFGGSVPREAGRRSNETWALFYVQPAPSFLDPVQRGLLVITGLVSVAVVISLWNLWVRRQSARQVDRR